MITKFGKRFLTNFIAGNVSFSNKEMAIGIANNSEYALANTNSRLGFEFYRLPVKFGGIDIDASVNPVKYNVIYSATLPSSLAGKINEIGIYPGGRGSYNYFESRFITEFESSFDWTPTPDVDQTNYRVGDSSLIFESNGTAAQEYKYILPTGFDLSGYSNYDTLTLSYRPNDSYLQSVKVRLYSSNDDYYQFTYTGHSLGYNIKELGLSQIETIGSPNKSNLNILGIVITPTTQQTSVSMDGLRINDEDTFDPNYGLIARSNITEVEKVAGRELLITYKLELSFGD